MSSVSSLSIEQASTCSVCTERYDEARRRPKVLRCGHTFCLRCMGEIAMLAGGVQRGQQDQEPPRRVALPLPCPTCRQLTVVGHRGVDRLTNNFAILGLVSREGGESKEEVFCERHRNEKMMFFCMDCHRLLCPYCAFHHMSHASSHTVEDVHFAAVLLRSRFRSALHYCREKTAFLDQTIRDLLTERRQLRTLVLSLDFLVNNTCDVELLSQRVTLRGLEEAGRMRTGTGQMSPRGPPVPQTGEPGALCAVELKESAFLSSDKLLSCGVGTVEGHDLLSPSSGEQVAMGEDDLRIE